MSRICSKTGKKPSVGNRRSHSNRATKRLYKPNLQVKRIFDPKTGSFKRMKVSTSYIRTLAKRLQKGQSV